MPGLGNSSIDMDVTNGIDVTTDEMAAETITEPQGRLKIDGTTAVPPCSPAWCAAGSLR